MTFDIIGDIHGHAESLTRLLRTLGYRERAGVFFHPDEERHVLFVGDFIDRGPDIVLTLEIVRRMIDHGTARAVLGNHEYNALCFHHSHADSSDRWLRPRSDKNIRQHLETLYQFRHNQTRLHEHLEWFVGLPLFLDLGVIRVVHAAWHQDSIRLVTELTGGENRMDERFLLASADRRRPEYDAVEAILKGVEVELPQGATYLDKDGHERHRTRGAWWMDWSGRTYGEIHFPVNNIGGADAADIPIPAAEARRFSGYRDAVPVFFGHYWLTGASPRVQAYNACCVDYSVARGGALAAYTWSGERELSAERFTLSH